MARGTHLAAHVHVKLRSSTLGRAAAVALIPAIFACSSSGGSGDDGAGTTTELMVMGTDLGKDVTVYDDRLELPLQDHRDLLDVPVGKILAGAPGGDDANPRGFLRRAKSAHAVGDKLVIDTDKPLLTDLFQGHARVALGDSSDNPVQSAAIAPVLRPEGWTDNFGGEAKLLVGTTLASIAIGLVDPVKTNQKFHANVTLAGGSFTFRPRVNSDLELTRGSLSHALLSASGEMSASVDVDFDVRAEGDISTARTGLLQPFRIDQRIGQWDAMQGVTMVGGVPVWQTLELSLNLRCDVSLNGEANFRLKVAARSSGAFGAEYDPDNGWQPIWDGPSVDASGSSLTVNRSGTADVKCGLEPQLALLVYDMLGPTLALGPTLTTHVDGDAHSWTAQAGFRADIGVLLEFARYQIRTESFSIGEAEFGDPLHGTY